jgi:hypothetical protein
VRRFRLLLVLVSALCAGVPVHAQHVPPPVVTEGLEAYLESGPAAAMELWTRNWLPEIRKEGMTRLLAAFEEIGRMSGPPIGHDYLGSAAFGPHVRRVYLVLLHRDRPAHLRLDVYENDGVWSVLNIVVHTDPSAVYPAEMLVPRG